jgi:hypothetical protein
MSTRWDLAEQAIADAMRAAGLDGVASGLWLDEYLDHPARFARRVLGETWWKMQREVARKLIEHRRVVHISCKKSGKTHGAGGIILAFQAAGPCRTICLAPTHRQVKELLWAGVRTQHAKSRTPLPGTMLAQSYRLDADNYALAFATDEPDRLQGFHTGVRPEPDYEDGELDPDELDTLTPDFLAGILETVGTRRLLWVLDEAVGIKPALWPLIESSLQGPNAYALAQANPTRAYRDPHPFMRLLQPGSGWHRIHTSAVEVPPDAMVEADEHYQVPHWLADPEWIERAKRNWGEDSALFHALVYGVPADTGEEGAHLVSYDLLEAALAAGACNPGDGAHIGADLARQGKDSIAFSLLVEGVKRAELVIPTRDLDPLTLTMDLIVKLEAQRSRWAREFGVEIPWENVHLDAGGLGGPICDRLVEKGAYVDAVDFGAGPEKDWEDLVGWETQFLNRRAELHWIERRALQEGLLHYPREFETTWAEACWATYEMLQDRKTGTTIKIEPKAKLRERYGRSPDTHDADLLALSRAGGLPSFGRMG